MASDPGPHGPSSGSPLPLDPMDDSDLLEEATIHARVDVQALFAQANRSRPGAAAAGAPGFERRAGMPLPAPSPPQPAELPPSKGILLLFSLLWVLIGALVGAFIVVAVPQFREAIARSLGVSLAEGGPEAASPPGQLPTASEPSQASEPSEEQAAELAKMPAEDRTVADVLALERFRQLGRLAELDSLSAAAEASPDVLLRADTRKRWQTLVADPATQPATLRALAELGSAPALDLLYALRAVLDAEVSQAVASELLRAKDVAPGLSPSLAVALKLEAPPPTCDGVLSLVSEVARVGDERSVKPLGRLVNLADCGPQNHDYCYPCLRFSGDVRPALLTAARRKVPPL